MAQKSKTEGNGKLSRESREYVEAVAKARLYWDLKESIGPMSRYPRTDEGANALRERNLNLMTLAKAAEDGDRLVRGYVHTAFTKIKYETLPDDVYAQLLAIRDRDVRAGYGEIFEIQRVRRRGLSGTVLVHKTPESLSDVIEGIPSGEELEKAADPAEALRRREHNLRQLAAAAGSKDDGVRAKAREGLSKVDGHRMPDDVYWTLMSLKPAHRDEARQVIGKQQLLRGRELLKLDGLVLPGENRGTPARKAKQKV